MLQSLLLGLVPHRVVRVRLLPHKPVSVVQNSHLTAILAEYSPLLGSEGKLPPAKGTGGQDILQPLGHAAVPVAHLGMTLQPFKLIVIQLGLNLFGDLLHSCRLDLIGTHESGQLHLHKRPPTEAIPPLGIGHVVAAHLDGVYGGLGLLQKRIRTGLNVLEPPRRGKPRLGHHGQKPAAAKHPQGIHGTFGIGGEHALGEAPEPSDELP